MRKTCENVNSSNLNDGSVDHGYYESPLYQRQLQFIHPCLFFLACIWGDTSTNVYPLNLMFSEFKVTYYAIFEQYYRAISIQNMC